MAKDKKLSNLRVEIAAIMAGHNAGQVSSPETLDRFGSMLEPETKFLSLIPGQKGIFEKAYKEMKALSGLLESDSIRALGIEPISVLLKSSSIASTRLRLLSAMSSGEVVMPASNAQNGSFFSKLSIVDGRAAADIIMASKGQETKVASIFASNDRGFVVRTDQQTPKMWDTIFKKNEVAAALQKIIEDHLLPQGNQKNPVAWNSQPDAAPRQ